MDQQPIKPEGTLSNRAPEVKFSIIVACKNEVAHIEQCLASVHNQTYRNWELIIVDGASTDGTLEMIRTNAKQADQWISEPDQGIHEAWNKALDLAAGDWIYFLGADDELASADVLERVNRCIQTGGLHELDLVCGAIQLRNGRTQKFYPPLVDRFPYRMIPHQGTFHSKKLFANHDRYSGQFRIRSDYEFLVRLWSKHGLKMTPLDINVAIYSGGISMSNCYRLRTFRETFRIRKQYHLRPYAFDMLSFLAKALVKQLFCVLSGMAGNAQGA